MTLRIGSAFTRCLRGYAGQSPVRRACMKPAAIGQQGEMFPGSLSDVNLSVASCGAAEEAERKRREEPIQVERLFPDDQTGDTMPQDKPARLPGCL